MSLNCFIKTAKQSESPLFTISLHSSIDSGGMVPYILLPYVNTPEFNAFPSHTGQQNLTVNLLHTAMPGLRRIFSARSSTIAVRNVRSRPFSYWENRECLHHASLPREGKTIALISGEVASGDVRKLIPESFPCSLVTCTVSSSARAT